MSVQDRTTVSTRWRTVDIVTTAVLGVAFGVVFILWNLVNSAVALVPPVGGIMNGVYLLPGVVAGLLVRKPGAATFASTLAAAVSLLASPYGGIIVVYGLVQGLGAELGFALARYRSFGWGTAVLAAVTAGLATTVLDMTIYYPAVSFWAVKVPYGALTVLSSVVVAGVLGLLLVRALARTGALSAFASGRSRV
ncbi:energy-coupling factor transport system substrate-specific component [Klenkia marina]|uniref:Energy-coupling factor transport system substrate-specific component n=1 Tax=Klenkia marina TaxID=1960309 RepID=A0A1G4YY07_9ACTN|nr:ECF transporter S component [Klenkia marina]SCX58316.1 energy-coupling factor transport system substrate-specific component [Klenkia marina]